MALAPFTCFPYSWHVDDEGVIHIFGLDPENKSIHVSIDNFTPYTYMELPDGIEWTDARRQAILSVLNEFPGEIQPSTKSFMNKKRLYYANVVPKEPQGVPKEPSGVPKEPDTKAAPDTKGTPDEKYTYKSYPYLFLAFPRKESMMGFIKKMSFGIYIPSLGRKIRFKFHEQDASPVLQLTTCRGIPVTGWISGWGKPQLGIDRSSSCHTEYACSWSHLEPCTDPVISKMVPCPRILMFDCEANSANIATMPKNRPDDKIFQISMALMTHGNPSIELHLLSLGQPDPKAVGEDVRVHTYPTEGDLLCGFAELIHNLDPQIVGGYNILGWDFDYMIKRAKQSNVFQEFTKLGYLLGVSAKEKKISWSSSAFNSQNFVFLDIPGRLIIDMLPIIRRDFKLNKYDLSSVSKEILVNVTKDPLTHKGIFKCYRIFSPASLALVGKYCVKDSYVTMMLFDKLKTWIGSCQLSATFGVPIIDLYTQGQQVKIYAQVYRDVLNKNFVVEKDGFVCAEDESYTGAIVLDPVPGLYKDVITFDFASLYPSIIIAGNIDYSTYVTNPNIPDSDCHIFEWEDHQGCCHDTTKRTTKVKKVLCCKRRYRFLKHPIGVLPSILVNLLGERKKTKKELEQVEAQVKDEKDPEVKRSLQMYATVLDMRQLAIKIACNSMYGGMGVRRGKLPFMIGAMSTTAGGRAALMKARQVMGEKFPHLSVYGDSVTGDTPVVVKNSYNVVHIQPIKFLEFLLQGNWDSYTGFKMDDTIRLDKEKMETSGWFIWTDEGWKEIRKLIRHRVAKRIFRIRTGNGVIDVTEDHSLFTEDHVKIKPKDVNVGTRLLTSFPNKFDEVNIEINQPEGVVIILLKKCNKCGIERDIDEFHKGHKICKCCRSLYPELYHPDRDYTRPYIIGEDEAWVWGLFLAEGSCGYYTCPSGSKHSWAINNANLEVLEKAKAILERVEPLYRWKLLDTIKSSAVYKLVPSGKVAKIVAKYRSYMYSEKNKWIHPCILNAPLSVRKAFFDGYYVGDGLQTLTTKKYGYSRFGAKSQIAAQCLFYLAKSIGIENITVWHRPEKDFYEFALTEHYGHKNDVRGKIDLGSDEQIVYDIETESGKFHAGVGEIIPSNTDSLMVVLQGLERFHNSQGNLDYKMMESHAHTISAEVSKSFPPPMKLEFENISKQFLIFKKKKYITELTTGKVKKRGILISRRDNAPVCRAVYEYMIKAIFTGKSRTQIEGEVLDMLNDLYSHRFPTREYCITKSIKELDQYKIKPLDKDPVKRAKQMANKLLDSQVHSEADYLLRSLPAHVQLAERMRRRGMFIEAGSRLEYVVTTAADVKGKIWQKIEAAEYYQEHSDVIRLDMNYYCKSLMNPGDQVLETAFQKKGFFKEQFELRCLKTKCLEELTGCFLNRVRIEPT